MLALSKRPSSTHARLSRSYLVGRRILNSYFPSNVVLLRGEWEFPVQKYRGLICTAGRNLSGCGEAINGAGRLLSSRAAMAGTGKKMETPAIPSFIEIRELAKLLRMKPKEVFKSLGGYQERKMHRIVLGGMPYAFPKLGNIIVPFEDVQALARRLNKDIRFLDVEKKPDRVALGLPVDSRENAWEDEGGEGVGRRPVVVLLGHFNHGKTTILDALLGPDSGIAEREAGGITQEIRARTVSLETSDEHSVETGGRAGKISMPGSAKVATFLDTPGQEIFYRMRTNGARVADAVVLVVSAVDGVCLQTSESIGCAEELGLPVMVVLNKVDLLPDKDTAKRLADLSEEVREFIALEHAQVLPISAHTGYGLGKLRVALVRALGRASCSSENSPTTETDLVQNTKLEEREDNTTVDALASESGGGTGRIGVSVVEAPEGAATATVLDYVSSAKTGKMLLVLVDRGVLRPGNFFALGAMWGSVRSLYDEEGSSPLRYAGPGVAAKVVVVCRTSVLNAPLGEPFRVLTEEAAEKVAVVRLLAQTIGNFIDHRRLESDFPHVLEEEAAGVESVNDDCQQDGAMEEGSAVVTADTAKDVELSRVERETPQRITRLQSDDDDLAPEDMPVSIVVKADSANTLASILDALGDWSEVNKSEESPDETIAGNNVERALADQGHVGQRRRQWGEGDLQHRPRQRLLVSVARSGIGAVTSSDVRLARDCECPVFAHSVTADAGASRELKRFHGGIIKALPESAVHEREIRGIGGQEGFIGRAGEGRECVVVSETVGELLGEIERFVLRVR